MAGSTRYDVQLCRRLLTARSTAIRAVVLIEPGCLQTPVLVFRVLKGAYINAKDGLPLLGRPLGGVGGRSSFIDCSTHNQLQSGVLIHLTADELITSRQHAVNMTH